MRARFGAACLLATTLALPMSVKPASAIYC